MQAGAGSVVDKLVKPSTGRTVQSSEEERMAEPNGGLKTNRLREEFCSLKQQGVARGVASSSLLNNGG